MFIFHVLYCFAFSMKAYEEGGARGSLYPQSEPNITFISATEPREEMVSVAVRKVAITGPV